MKDLRMGRRVRPCPTERAHEPSPEGLTGGGPSLYSDGHGGPAFPWAHDAEE